MLEKHFFLCLFLGKNHVEGSIVEIISNTVRVTVHHFGDYILVDENLLFVTFIYHLRLDSDSDCLFVGLCL